MINMIIFQGTESDTKVALTIFPAKLPNSPSRNALCIKITINSLI